MLMPKRVKRRKQFRGSMKGKALRGNKINYGEFGLVALEPCFYANFTVSGICFSESIIDIGTQGLQRNSSLAVELGTSHIRTKKEGSEN